MRSPSITNNLEAILQQPNIEASPAWEFINGQRKQKPLPTLFHSRLQRNLVNAINNKTQVYEAILQLRCIIPPFSPVPDIVVVKRERLGDIAHPLDTADWIREIRSRDQSTLDLQNKILHCLSNGTQLAWLIDIQRQQIWVWSNHELPLVYAGTDMLPTLDIIFHFTVDQIIAMTRQH